MENITDQSIPQSPFRDLGFYKELKRSKRHRRKRNHISAKDLVECVKAWAAERKTTATPTLKGAINTYNPVLSL